MVLTFYHGRRGREQVITLNQLILIFTIIKGFLSEEHLCKTLGEAKYIGFHIGFVHVPNGDSGGRNKDFLPRNGSIS